MLNWYRTAFVLTSLVVTLTWIAATPEISTAGPRDIAFQEDGDGEEGDDEAKTGFIKGSVVKNGRALKRARIVVEIEGLGEKFKKKIEADGTFEFENVPMDKKYVIKATGSFKNATVKGEKEDVEAVEKKDDAEAIELAVE